MDAKNKSQDAVRTGLRPLYPRLWRYCLALTGNRQQAEDLAQSACLRALERADQFTPGTHLDRWVLLISRRLWLNEIRADAVRRGGGLAAFEDEQIADHAPNPEMNLVMRQVLLEVMKLPEAQRETVMLVYVEGYKYKEASEILEIPVGTVMSRLAAARSRLGSKFADGESALG